MPTEQIFIWLKKIKNLQNIELEKSFFTQNNPQTTTNTQEKCNWYIFAGHWWWRL